MGKKKKTRRKNSPTLEKVVLATAILKLIEVLIELIRKLIE